MSNNMAGAFVRFFDRATLRDLRDLAAFVKVTPGTALVWAEKNEIPKGESFYRLQYYLEGLGYEIEELQGLPKPAYKLGQLIAFDIIEMEYARDVLGYASLKDLYRLLQGASLFAKRGETLERLIKSNEGALQGAITAFKERHGPERMESTQSLLVPSETLSAVLMGGVDLLDNILDIVELQSQTSEEIPSEADRSEVSRLVQRLQRYS